MAQIKSEAAYRAAMHRIEELLPPLCLRAARKLEKLRHRKRGFYCFSFQLSYIFNKKLKKKPKKNGKIGGFCVAFLAFLPFAAILSLAATARKPLYLLRFQKVCGSVAANFQKFIF